MFQTLLRDWNVTTIPTISFSTYNEHNASGEAVVPCNVRKAFKDIRVTGGPR